MPVLVLSPIRLFVFLAVACSLQGAVAAPPTVVSTAQIALIDALVVQRLEERGAPGAVVAVARCCIVWRKAYGLADLSRRTPMRTDAAFEIGSVTKQMTAAAVMQLVEAGRITLADPLSRFFPAYREAGRVNVRQLLQQTSGIPDFAIRPGFLPRATERAARFDEVFALTESLPLDFEPGQRWAYSNSNYLLLSHIVEIVTGSDFEPWFQQHVLRRAGMRHTHARRGSNVRGFTTVAGRVERAPAFADGWVRGAGELVSTVDDLVAWNRALRGGRVVSPVSLAEMTQPARLSNRMSHGYGFGLFLDRQGSHARRWHGGGTLGMSSSSMSWPTDGLDIVVLVNHEAINASALSAEIFEVLHPDASVKQTHLDSADSALADRARVWLQALQKGLIDRDDISPAFRQRLARPDNNLRAQVDVYGRPESFVDEAGDENEHKYHVRFGAQWFRFTIILSPEGRLADASIEQG